MTRFKHFNILKPNILLVLIFYIIWKLALLLRLLVINRMINLNSKLSRIRKNIINSSKRTIVEFRLLLFCYIKLFCTSIYFGFY